MINNKTKGEINLSTLITNKNYKYQDTFYIEFYPDYKKEFMNTILKEAKTIRNLCKETKLKFHRVWDQLTRVPISLEVLKILSDYLIDKGYSNYSLENIQNNIQYIKSAGSKSQKLFHPKFPILLCTKEGMRFISHLYHDGCIGEFNKQLLFVNQSLQEIEEFIKDAQIIFGEFDRKPKIDFGHGKKRTLLYRINLPTVIGEIMIKAGYISGDKTRKNLSVLNFLKDIKDEELICEFLAKAFNDDGYIGKRSIGLVQACLAGKSGKNISKVLLLNKQLLNKINIKVKGPYLRRVYKNRFGLCNLHTIEIYSKAEIERFYNKIKLVEPKNKKIENYLLNWGLRKNNQDIYI